MPKTVKNATGAMDRHRRPPAPRKPYPSYCGQCHQPIDVPTLLDRIKAGRRYVHDCGRVLARGDAVLRLRGEETWDATAPATDPTPET